MDIIKIATEAGMQITLDGRIGREEYRSVVGSVQALERFADALCKSIVSGAGVEPDRSKSPTRADLMRARGMACTDPIASVSAEIS